MACASKGWVALLIAAATMSAGAGVASSAGDPLVSIELRPRVRVARASVRLADIAFLTSRDLSTLRKLMALPIGAAPRPGSPAVLDRETIMRWVETRSGFYGVASTPGTGMSAIQWGGASETAIESAAQELPGETVVDAARAALLAWLSQRSVRAEVQAASSTRDLVLPAGVPVLRVRPLADQSRPSRRMLVWVDAWVDDRFVRTTAVTFEVSAWAPLTVATTQMDSGAAVDAVLLRGGTEARDVDLASIKQGAPIDAGINGRFSELEAGRQRLRKPVKAGEVLTRAHLESMPAVVRGNWALLQARSGDVAVESRVEVLQDGREGQFVRVKVPGAKGEVLARVTGPGQVEVQP